MCILCMCMYKRCKSQLAFSLKKRLTIEMVQVDELWKHFHPPVKNSREATDISAALDTASHWGRMPKLTGNCAISISIFI